MDLRSPVWVRRTGGVRHIILRLKADWTDCGNSMKVRALMRSAAGELLSEKVEFVEKDEGRDCLMQLPIPESCAKVSFEFSGTYGQTLPEFRLLESVELTGAVLLSGEICSIFDDIAQCGALLKDMIANYAQLRTSTEKFAQNWVDFHNATRLVKLLS